MIKIFNQLKHEPLHGFMAIFLLLFSAWTVSAQFCTVFGWDLKTVICIFPFITLLLIYLYFITSNNLYQSQDWKTPVFAFNDRCKKNISILSLVLLLISPIALYCSYVLFFMLTLFLLGICLIPSEIDNKLSNIEIPKPCKKTTFILVGLITLAIIIVTYLVSRSDLDDAFYVAVAAFTSTHPGSPLLGTDPMFGEIGLPLLFPSYQFASFELLIGAIAYGLSVPVMDIYYIYLLPIWIITSIIATLLLTKELMPRYWLWGGVATLLLIVLLGEMHRSPANFSFVRLFQGKAVFLSTLVPTIFYLTARFFSPQGSNRDRLLLACCQVSAIGFTNFGMLAGPLVGFSALLSNLPLALKQDRKKLYSAIAILLIPLPYLLEVYRQAQGSPLLKGSHESAAQVFQSVFGPHQQYLVALLLLTGPVLARDTITRWRLAVPPLLLFGVYLNPSLAGIIANYITTPPVYWRVVWSFPTLIYGATAACMTLITLVTRKSNRLLLVLLTMTILGFTGYALPLNTLRLNNLDPLAGFATWKIPNSQLRVAQKAIQLHQGGRLLAPDEIAGIISRFEQRPVLINVREAYLELLRPALGEPAYELRRILYDFINSPLMTEDQRVRIALNTLDVSTIVVRTSNGSPEMIALLLAEHYKSQEMNDGYRLWKR